MFFFLCVDIFMLENIKNLERGSESLFPDALFLETDTLFLFYNTVKHL